MDSICVAFLLPRDQSLTSWLSDAILSKTKSKIAKLLGHGFSAAKSVHYFAWLSIHWKLHKPLLKSVTIKHYLLLFVFQHLPFLQAENICQDSDAVPKFSV